MTSSTRDSRPRQTRVRGIDLLRTSRRNSHIAVGTGLVSLDVVLAGEDGAVSGMWAGGSCGNVLTILSLLGWSAFPAGRLAQDGPADLIRDDLRKWKVHLDFLRSIPEGSTPVIVERILRTEGKLPSHVYDWRCPSCSSWLPRFKPIGREVVASIIQKVQQPEVFYFDRATPAAVDLATAYRKKGALVVFEPNGIGKEKWFQLAVSSSHVLKYSNEKVGRLGEAVSNVFPPLHVETLGGAGLRYKVGRGNWRSLPAASPPRVKDAAGAGDWCTAGLVHIIGRNGVKSLRSARQKELEIALNFGQSLAALNCMFEGARGAMYSLHPSQLMRYANSLLEGINERSHRRRLPGGVRIRRSKSVLEGICPHCEPTDGLTTKLRKGSESRG